MFQLKLSNLACLLVLGILCVLCVFVVSPSYLSAQDTPKDKDNRGISVVGKDGLTAVERGDFYLVVIGINNYINFPKLATAVNGVKEVKKVLLERYGFETKRLVELYDTDATAKRILAELRTLSGKIKPDDSLLIYYAGHGYLDEITKSGAWIPVDGAKDDPTTWLDNDILKKYLSVDAIKARHILLISDSCFAGDFFARSVSAPNITDAYVQTAFGKASREAITSGGVEPVSDAGFSNHSVFAHFLLKALKENTEPYLLTSAVHERVKGGVSANARQQTQYGLLTGTGGELGGSFVLFPKGATGNLDQLVKEKNERLSMLKQAEDEMKARNEAETSETKAREQKIAELDKQIAELQKKLGAAGQGDSSTLDQIVALVEQRERQAKELAEMKRKAEEERRQREAEIARLKQEEQQKQFTALEADIAKYQKVAQSEYGKDLKESAWNALLEKWGLQKGSIPTGNISALCGMLKLQAPPPAGFVEIGANQQGYQEYRHEPTGMVFVLIPGGTFRMGSNDGHDDEKPIHEVTVSNFLIGKYEVTQGVWQKIMGNNPSHFKGDNHPVEQVSWNDCQEFCRKAGLQLPTEAEWEYVCRAGTNTKYYWGNESNSNYMWYDKNSNSTTHPVGQKKPNAFGLYDIIGNVWEWCQDWYDANYYKNSPKDNPTGPSSGEYRVLRGGSWNNNANNCRTA
ncbi:MAG: SUMF1/EgtB/PvdO family nonheme iron enzyme, partial [Planctomycetota bacterium]|nr:SUMF1/EgtB/PvdO family nonheme iron enzyme [Planctomycetota bacterium]